MEESDHQRVPVLDVAPGRSAGSVTAPDVEPDLPPLTDEEIDEAVSDLGLTKLKIGQMKSVRKLGQIARELGTISMGRGLVLAGVGELMDLAEEAKTLTAETVEVELKEKFMRIRRDCAIGVTRAGETMVEVNTKKEAEAAPTHAELPQFGQQIGPTTQIVTKELHMHTHNA